jgi:hypothetical protein
MIKSLTTRYSKVGNAKFLKDKKNKLIQPNKSISLRDIRKKGDSPMEECNY